MINLRKPTSIEVSRRALMAGLGAVWATSSLTPAWAQSVPNDNLTLNGNWKFAFAADEAQADTFDGFQLPAFSGQGFKSTPVPSNWAVEGYEEPVYRGFKDGVASQGFYLHDFVLPAGWGGKRILLHFGGVWSSAEVWLNGTRLGRHDSGFTSFSYDVTKAIKSRGNNRLAVRVRQVTPEYLFDVYDDWTLGGIYRDVTLEAMPSKRWIDRLYVQTEFDHLYQDADLKIRVQVSDQHRSTVPGNYLSPDARPYALRYTLKDKHGVDVYQHQVEIEGHYATDRKTELVARIYRPQHWNAETPNLYDLTVELLEEGQPVQVRHERVGFRQISTKDGVFRINGKAVKLRGVNRHDEHPDVGRATRREHWLEDIALMKAANINFIRMAHYTHARGFIELCDEMGIYVGNEISIGGGSRDIFYDDAFIGGALTRTYETVIRDINSPSIIYWSIGNEDPITSMHMTSIKTTKALDPTRPVLVPWRAEDWLPPEVDIIAPHYWKPQDYDELASRSTRPVISTEYTHAYANHGMGGLDARWKALTRHPAGAGAAIWVWADQGIKAKTPKAGSITGDPYLRLTVDGWDGIVDSYRQPTRDYWETKAVYAQVFPDVETLEFIPGQASIQVPIRNEYDFTDLKHVTIHWSLYEDDRLLAKDKGIISGQPHAASRFSVPLESLANVHADKAYYLHFSFVEEGGREITKRSVELLSKAKVVAPVSTVSPVTVTEHNGLVVVTSGRSQFEFDPRKGHLIKATQNNKIVLGEMRPTIWHDLDDNERYNMGEKKLAELPDLNVFNSSVTAWSLTSEANHVLLSATVAYTVDTQNSFLVNYQYRVDAVGGLTVDYDISPRVQAPWIPIAGISIAAATEYKHHRWLGLGPYDAYPNKRTAPILGVWKEAPQERGSTGIKSVRWFERVNADGKGCRVTTEGYVEYQASAQDRISVLTQVLSRPEKDRMADETLPQLKTDTGELFRGNFKIELL